MGEGNREEQLTEKKSERRPTDSTGGSHGKSRTAQFLGGKNSPAYIETSTDRGVPEG